MSAFDMRPVYRYHWGASRWLHRASGRYTKPCPFKFDLQYPPYCSLREASNTRGPVKA